MSKRDHHPSSERFIPALWKQRRSFILDTLSRFQVESVLDYGCGEASVLSFLTCPELKFRRLAGIDIDPGVLEEAIGECMPIQSDYAFPRSDSLHVDIYQGSIGVADDRFTTYDAIVCSEVIEHVYASVLDSFLDLTLGTYGPALMIVTTPNSEYNVHFPDLKYGTLHATFRHDDHKFEWTRKEFEAWCLEGANKYGYQTEFHGIGLLDDDTSHGHCTQACLFIRPYARHSTPSLGQRHQLLKHIEFPFDCRLPLSPLEQIKEIKRYIQTLCDGEVYYRQHTTTHKKKEKEEMTFEPIEDWTTFKLSYIPEYKHTEPAQDTACSFDLVYLWSIPHIQRVCQTQDCLRTALIACCEENKDLLFEQDVLYCKLVFY